jgi:hypothetical protein
MSLLLKVTRAMHRRESSVACRASARKRRLRAGVCRLTQPAVRLRPRRHAAAVRAARHCVASTSGVARFARDGKQGVSRGALLGRGAAWRSGAQCRRHAGGRRSAARGEQAAVRQCRAARACCREVACVVDLSRSFARFSRLSGGDRCDRCAGEDAHAASLTI